MTRQLRTESNQQPLYHIDTSSNKEIPQGLKLRSFGLGELDECVAKTTGASGGYTCRIDGKKFFLKKTDDIFANLFNSHLLRLFGIKTPDPELWIEKETGQFYLASEEIVGFRSFGSFFNRKDGGIGFKEEDLEGLIKSLSSSNPDLAKEIKPLLLVANLAVHDVNKENIGICDTDGTREVAVVDLDFLYQNSQDALRGALYNLDILLGKISFSSEDLERVTKIVENGIIALLKNPQDQVFNFEKQYKSAYNAFFRYEIHKKIAQHKNEAKGIVCPICEVFDKIENIPESYSTTIPVKENQKIFEEARLLWLCHEKELSVENKNKLKEGLRAIESNTGHAIGLFLELEKSGYKHPYIYYQLGLAFSKRQQWGDNIEAIKYLDLAEEFGHRDENLYYERALAKHRTRSGSEYLEDILKIENPIMFVTEKGNEDVAIDLINYYAKDNEKKKICREERNIKGDNNLTFALLHKKARIAKELIATGLADDSDINYKNGKNKNALLVAYDALAQTGNEEFLAIIKELIKKGANVDHIHEKRSILSWALSNLRDTDDKKVIDGLIKGIHLLIDNMKGDINELSGDGRSNLLISCDALAATQDERVLAIIKKLIAKGSNPNFVFEGNNILHYTISNLNNAPDENKEALKEAAQELINAGARDASSLFYAVQNQDLEMLKLILAKKAGQKDFNPNITDQWGIHIIVKAVESGVPAIVQLLIDAGVDLLNDNTKLNGKTILEVAEDIANNNPNNAEARAIADKIRTTINQQQELASTHQGRTLQIQPKIITANIGADGLPSMIDNLQQTDVLSAMPSQPQIGQSPNTQPNNVALVKSALPASFDGHFLLMVWTLRFIFGFDLKTANISSKSLEEQWSRDAGLGAEAKNIFTEENLKKLSDIRNKHPDQLELLEMAFSQNDPQKIISNIRKNYPNSSQQVIDDLSEALSNVIKNVEEREKTAKPLTGESFKELTMTEAEPPKSNPQVKLKLSVSKDPNSRSK